jgi:DNA-directed RNA polymerase subunit beta'
LSGKRGRFRNDLLGKRINYSARSVIIPIPELALNQCGLPHNIILILFQPFFIRFLKEQLKNRYKIRSHIQARQFLHQETNERWIKRTQILTEFPILFNRAPTVHRFNFQSFQPLLFQIRAIQLHPLLCFSFNADFDGDQIAVYFPIFFGARHESWRLVIPGSLFFFSNG